MTKKVTTVVALVLLAGCTNSDAMFLAQAKFICKDHGGIHSIGRFEGVVCADNTWTGSGAVAETIITDQKFYPEKYHEEHNRD